LLCGINVDLTRHQVIMWTVIRAFGLGLAFMPIMTNGLSWLPPHLVGHGGAMNNIMQRMSAALGVAAMGTLISRETAQLSSDLGALQTGSSMPQFQNADTRTLLGLYQQFEDHVHAMADADMFAVTTAATAACALLALMLKKAPRPASAQAPTPDAPAQEPAKPARARSDARVQL
jgi:hypothetical protein